MEETIVKGYRKNNMLPLETYCGQVHKVQVMKVRIIFLLYFLLLLSV